MSRAGSRASDMRASLARVARAHGVDEPGLALLDAAYRAAIEPRGRALGSEEHPAFLHPGRTVLVLLRDAAVTDASVLAAGALTESRIPAARVEPAVVRDMLDDRGRAVHAGVPDHAAPDLAERLVTASDAVRLVALVEHLDHLRHLHMVPPTDDWRALFEAVEAVWGPVAERTHPEVARRYGLWLRTFARRLGRVG